jgi:hypothetical protein
MLALTTQAQPESYLLLNDWQAAGLLAPTWFLSAPGDARPPVQASGGLNGDGSNAATLLSKPQLACE